MKKFHIKHSVFLNVFALGAGIFLFYLVIRVSGKSFLSLLQQTVAVKYYFLAAVTAVSTLLSVFIAKRWSLLMSAYTDIKALPRGFIFYNTNMLNDYRNSDAGEALQADYEKTLKATYEWAPQPKIKTVKLNLEIYPEDRSFHINGHYSLVNKTNAPLEEVYVQLSSNSDMDISQLSFDRETTVNEDYKRFKFFNRQS